jgi:hypothetical protein
MVSTCLLQKKDYLRDQVGHVPICLSLLHALLTQVIAFAKASVADVRFWRVAGFTLLLILACRCSTDVLITFEGRKPCTDKR